MICLGLSQRVRKRVEEILGWIKTVGNFRRTRYRGLERTSFAAYLVGADTILLSPATDRLAETFKSLRNPNA